ncbi:MAG: penicillin-binding protein activator LpoB [Gammaproteobacteria bacterium]|nr:penicillin-binding protein activator LpoB [Sideroxydans sp.]MBU3904161.1 penicillin-binding protein activator LpoB [Gammaproteobacteria bacterium]MBU4046271.1 penicillin-binding protein activator LpoB [Gammaproteobacteria bacterium]MBU4151027.1 penicillin-binding protein activator LpoB [Gammaproteobacteria bacterium]
MRTHSLLPLSAIALLLSACATPDAGKPVTYQDVNSTGVVAGVGVESQDVTAVTDAMVKDILATPEVVKRSQAARVILDAAYFENESSQRINKNLLVDRLRINLQRAAQGKLQFVSRESADMVAQERDMKRQGTTDAGTLKQAKATAGADYRLIGRINSLDARSAQSGTVERYTQITFELIDLETSLSIWSNLYEFKKGGQDDAVYR